MGAEANPGKVWGKMMFLFPSIALPQPFSSGADICLSISRHVPTAAQKRDETLLQGQCLGHQAALEADLHPNLMSLCCPAACQTSSTLHSLLLSLIWQKSHFSRPRDPHFSPLTPSSSPVPTPASSHPHFVMPLGIHYSYQCTALQSKAF